MHTRGDKPWRLGVVLCAGMIACCSSASYAANSIRGVIRNQTVGHPSAGDEVILLDIDHGMREESRTRTDSQGAFALDLPDPGKQHMIRVVHQGVNYDHEVSTDSVVSIGVFDAAAKLKGISGSIEIIRAGSNGNLLHISDMVEIRNDSNPPMTQASERTFEAFLPANAKIDSVLAAGPENIGEAISPVQVREEPGHYTVSFPLKPGATKFAFNYDLPYDGRAVFRTRTLYPLQQLAVMIPPTMTFTTRSASFQILPVGNDRYRVEAAEQLKAGDGLSFEISGLGALPAMQDRTHALLNSPVSSPVVPASSARSIAGPRTQSATSVMPTPVSGLAAPSSRWRWWILGATAALMFGTCGFLVWRRQLLLANSVAAARQVIRQAGETSPSLIVALKEGLFQLETDRLRGAIFGEEYAITKRALEDTIHWALTRNSSRGETTPL